MKFEWRDAIGLFFVLLAPLVAASALESEPHSPPLERGERPIALSPLPASSRVGGFEITIRRPADPELAALGGSGGPMLELLVSGPGGPVSPPTTLQAIWLFGRSRADDSPAFSVWSRTGVSNYVQCRLELVERTYCTTWCQDFEVTDSGIEAVGARRTDQPCR